MPATVRSQPLSYRGGDSRSFQLSRLLLLPLASVMYMLPPMIDGVGCHQGCGYDLFSYRIAGGLIGGFALLLLAIALTRGVSIFLKKRAWDALIGIGLALAACGGLFLHLVPDPTMSALVFWLPDPFLFLNVPQVALIYATLTLLPVLLLLSTLTPSVD